MKKIILSTAVVAIALMVSDVAEAKGNNKPSVSKPSVSKPQTSKFHCYPKNYCSWDRYCWNSKYNCCFFYCPTTCCHYYWYAPSSCYCPVSCIDTYPPTKFESEKVQVSQITNVNVGGQQTNQEIVDPPTGSGPSAPLKAPVK